MSMRTLFAILFVFACLSLLVLRSIYPAGMLSQIFAFVIGFAVFLLAQAFPFRSWKRIAFGLFAAVLFLLCVTFFIGKTTKGSTRWIPLGTAQFQPSQIAKPMYALVLAMYAAGSLKKGKRLARFLLLAGVPFLLVFFQPDLGTSLIFLTIAGAILVMSDVSWRVLVGLVLGALVLALASWIFVLHDYQRQRVLSFLRPEEQTLGTGYHAQQAMIAVGSGKLFGRGLGRGVQSELQFLPEKHTDFFFASLAEELGFFGTALVFVLYIALFRILFALSGRVKDAAAALFCHAAIAALLAQTGINLGMNIGLFPITGITLPLLSYGGSSVIATFLFLGVFGSAARTIKPGSPIEFRSFV